jgi:hypothetical protein
MWCLIWSTRDLGYGLDAVLAVMVTLWSVVGCVADLGEAVLG